MHNTRLHALKERHEKLEERIYHESTHPARDALLIDQLKKEKLRVRDEMERLKKTG